MITLPIVEFNYDQGTIERGYANRTLHINLTDMTLTSKPVTQKMKEIFIGGRGFDLWLLWNSLPHDRIIQWHDPENEVCIACGPLGGTTIYPGSGKSIAASISPLTHTVIDSNAGGYFGPYLKFSGWDALEIQGKASREVTIFIDGDQGRVLIEDAEDLPSDTHSLGPLLTARYGNETPQSISIISAGPGAEHTRLGCLNFSWYDHQRQIVRYKQAGRGGIGTVLRDKHVKAIVVQFSALSTDINQPAHSEVLKQVGPAYNQEIRTLDPQQHRMALVGTTHLVPIMNDVDLLPTHNFKFGQHPDAAKIGEDVYLNKFDRGYDGCWIGCMVACSHGVKDFTLTTGPYQGEKVFVNGPEYETIASLGSNCGIFDPDSILEMNFYCDAYGLDTISVGTAIAFAMECYELNLISKKHTGNLELTFGNKDVVLQLIHQMAKGKSFGAIIGQGVREMKRIFAQQFGSDLNMLQDIGMEAKGLEFSLYVTKESLAQQGGYGLALKGPQHDEAWLIFLDMIQNLMPTFEQKAENLYWFPMFRTWFSLNGLCKLPWNDIIPEGNSKTQEPAKIVEHVNHYAKYFYAVTGRQVTIDDIIHMSERVYTFQRIFNLRMGFGRREHDNIPYRAVGPVTEEEYESRMERYDQQLQEKVGYQPEGKTIKDKLTVLRIHRETEYERLKDAVYRRREWTTDGVPTLKHIKRLGIDFPDVIALIQRYQ
jgi:aldehyde:ferredoxin oxidoreductase